VKVFLSWSGGRSKSTAEALGNWVARVIQAVEPWISSGIEKGARWQSEIAERLEDAKVGIVCLTSSNLGAPWILFEAGALSKTKGSYVCTFLLDVSPAGIEPPLGQFQHTVFTRTDVFKLVETINAAVAAAGERSLSEPNLVAVFDTFWPQLEEQLNKSRNQDEGEVVTRSERGLLEEVLEILRAQEQRAQKQATLNSLGAKLRLRQIQKRLDVADDMSPTTTPQSLDSALSRYLEHIRLPSTSSDVEVEDPPPN
jgi:hypothetical protein